MPSLLLIVLSWLALLQEPQFPPPPSPQAAAIVQAPQAEYKPVPLATPKVHGMSLVVGRGELLQFSGLVDRVAVSEPAIADAVVVGPQEVVVKIGRAHV